MRRICLLSDNFRVIEIPEHGPRGKPAWAIQRADINDRWQDVHTFTGKGQLIWFAKGVPDLDPGALAILEALPARSDAGGPHCPPMRPYVPKRKLRPRSIAEGAAIERSALTVTPPPQPRRPPPPPPPSQPRRKISPLTQRFLRWQAKHEDDYR